MDPLVKKLSQISLDEFTQQSGIPIHQQQIPDPHPNRPGTFLTSFKAIVVHYTANEWPQATDTVNAKYFGRTFKEDPIKKEPLEKDGKTPFRYGSTQLLFDMDSGTQALPLNSVSWALGDRPNPYTSEFKGQQPLAKYVFGNKQNYQTLNIEICNNDAIKNSNEDWEKGVVNAKTFIIWLLKKLNLTINFDWSAFPKVIASSKQEGLEALGVNEVLLLRHHDLTGKMCPRPFIGQPGSVESQKWSSFVFGIAEATSSFISHEPPKGFT